MPLLPGARRCMPGHQALVTLLLLTACSHGEVPGPVTWGTDDPHEPGTPTQLTYSDFADLNPSWFPGGGRFLYTFGDALSRRLDQCLGEMAGTGGQLVRTRCSTNDNQDDSTDVLLQPTPRADGQLAWVEHHNVYGRTVWDYAAISLGTLNPAAPVRRLVRLPYTSTTGNAHYTALSLRWLTPTQLAYIGADVFVRAPCDQCKRDTLLIAREVMLLDAETGAPPTVIPNSAETTSIWPTGDGGYYFTLANSSIVYRRSLADDHIEAVHDFGLLGIARDVSVAGNTLSAIVGGNVFYGFEPNIGNRQIDSGGVVMTVDLSTNQEQVFPSDGLTRFRRGVLSPDGRSLIAEGVTLPAPNPNLWLYQVP